MASTYLLLTNLWQPTTEENFKYVYFHAGESNIILSNQGVSYWSQFNIKEQSDRPLIKLHLTYIWISIYFKVDLMYLNTMASRNTLITREHDVYSNNNDENSGEESDDLVILPCALLIGRWMMTRVWRRAITVEWKVWQAATTHFEKSEDEGHLNFDFLIYICRYHGIPDNPYPYPCDDDEVERLNVLQWIISIYYKGNIQVPLSAGAKQVYDIGTGSGYFYYWTISSWQL